MNMSKSNPLFINSLESVSINYDEQTRVDDLRKNHSKRVKYYFDTYDIMKMIDGLREFNSGYLVQEDFFEKPQNLVRAIAYFGWLGREQIGLLPGHKEELFSLIKNRYVNYSEDHSFFEGLLESIGLNKEEFNSSEYKNNLELKLNAIKNESVNLFLLNFILDKNSWLDRAEYLVQFRLDLTESINDIEIFETDLFNSLFKYFEQERPMSTKSNVRDAISLYCLHKKLIEFENGVSPILPIYFVSTKTMIDLQKKPHLKKFFVTTSLPDSNEFCILKNYEFIIVDVLFKSTRNDEEWITKIREIKSAINSLKTLNNIDEHYLARTVDGFQLKFFEKFLFDKKNKTTLCNEIIQLIDFHSIEKDKENIKEIFKKQLDNVLQKLQDDKVSLKLLCEVWDSTKSFSNKLSKLNLDLYRKSKNPFTSFGLTRFSFDHYREIMFYLEHVILADSLINDVSDFSNLFVSQLYSGLMNTSDNINLIEKTVALLWILDEHDNIIKICIQVSKVGNLTFSLRAIYCSSLMKSKSSKSLELISNEIAAFEKISFDIENYKKELMLGYLYFNFWKRDNHELIPEFSENKELSENIVNAIEYTKRSLSWLKQNRIKIEELINYRSIKYAYVLNNYIYYVTTGADSEQLSKLSRLKLEFLDIRRQQPSLWQPRFEETMALYYFRNAFLETDFAKRTSLLSDAKRHINEGQETAVSEHDGFAATREAIRELENNGKERFKS